MASNPHSDFTTHNRTLPTLSNLPIFTTVRLLFNYMYCVWVLLTLWKVLKQNADAGITSKVRWI